MAQFTAEELIAELRNVDPKSLVILEYPYRTLSTSSRDINITPDMNGDVPVVHIFVESYF